MVQSCSAYGCKNRYHKDKNISFHKFPLARPDVCGKWIAAMRRNNFIPTKYSNICSQHFTKDCFKRECNNRVLKENAVPSLFCSSKLQIKTECPDDPFPPEMNFPMGLPLSDSEVPPVLEPAGLQPEASPLEAPPLGSPDTARSGHSDHNYTGGDSVQQKKRIEQLEKQVDSLRKKLRTAQQKCRRQEHRLKRLKAVGDFQRVKGLTLGDGYVILPKQLYDVLKGMDTIDGL